MGILAAVALLSACTVGPDYQRPSAPVPALYREAGWQVGEPIDVVDRGAWWSVYNDAVLDGLKKQIDITNQNLKAAEVAFQQAEWIVAQARAGYFSSATVDASAQRSRGGGTAGGDHSGRGWRGRWQDHQLLQHIDHGELDPGFVGFAASSSKGFKDDRERYRQCDQEDL